MIARRFTILALVLVVVVAASVGWWTRHQLLGAIVPRELERMRADAATMARQIEHHAKTASEDVAMLAGLSDVRSLAEAAAGSDGPTDARARVEAVFVQHLESKPWVLQARVIGLYGECLELARVHRIVPGGAVQVVGPESLQPKGHRPYVRAGHELGLGEVHVSELDPNVEEGEVVRPFQAVIRAVARVGGVDAQPAVVVINVDMESLMDSFVATLHPGGHIYVVDERGSYIHHPEGDRFEFAAVVGSPHDWREDFPELARGVTETAVVSAPEHPTGSGDGRARAGDRVGAATASTSLRPGVRVLETAPHQALATAVGGVWRSAATVGAIALVGTLLVVWVFATAVLRPLKAMAREVGSFDHTGWDLSGLPRRWELGLLTSAFERLAGAVDDRTSELEREVHERAEAQSQLREHVELLKEAEDRFRRVFESSPSGMCVVDDQGVIRLVNDEMERLFKYSREEFAGMRVDRLVPASDRGAHAHHRGGYMENPSPRLMGDGRELNAVRKDRTQFPVEIGLAPLQLWGGRAVIASVVDVTHRRESELELQRYASRLEQSNRELEKFAYVVSHDLKAPLRGISSVASWIAEDFGPVVDDEARENLALLTDRVGRLSLLIDGILEYSRAGTGDEAPESVDVGALVDDVLRSIETPDGIAARREGEFPTLEFNPTKLRQVFQNLIDNAAEHLGKPGGEIVVTCEPQGDWWRFSVRDDGVGIPERHYDRIFELFQTLRPKDECGTTGAGLAIIKRIVESAGGAITVESVEGEWTEFAFTLPSSLAAVADGAAPEAAPERGAT